MHHRHRNPKFLDADAAQTQESKILDTDAAQTQNPKISRYRCSTDTESQNF